MVFYPSAKLTIDSTDFVEFPGRKTVDLGDWVNCDSQVPLAERDHRRQRAGIALPKDAEPLSGTPLWRSAGDSCDVFPLPERREGVPYSGGLVSSCRLPESCPAGRTYRQGG